MNMKKTGNEYEKFIFNDVIKIIESIGEGLTTNASEIDCKKRKGGPIYPFYKKLPISIRTYLLRPLISNFEKAVKIKKEMNERDEIFYIGNTEKKFSLDFLKYIISKGSNFSFDIKVFNKEDRPRVLNFIRTKLIFAFLDKKKKTEVIDKENFHFIDKYKKFNEKIIMDRGFFHLNYDGDSYALPLNSFTFGTFVHNLGTHKLPNEVKQSLMGKDFIDCGAFVGDTSLMLNKLKPKSIFAFEPVTSIYNLLLKTVKLNNSKNIFPVNKGVGDAVTTANIKYNGGASHVSKEGELKVKIETIDNFAHGNNLDVGLIKMDIEGYEFNAIMGAKNIIKKNKPVLIISVYHTGKDFFEIPYLLKKWVPKYNFRFVDIDRTNPVCEKILLAYVD